MSVHMHQNMDEYLQIPDDYDSRKSEPGKKRVSVILGGRRMGVGVLVLLGWQKDVWLSRVGVHVVTLIEGVDWIGGLCRL